VSGNRSETTSSAGGSGSATTRFSPTVSTGTALGAGLAEGSAFWVGRRRADIGGGVAEAVVWLLSSVSLPGTVPKNCFFFIGSQED
jgi:hypothetical protein